MTLRANECRKPLLQSSVRLGVGGAIAMRVLLPNRSFRTVALCPEDTRERRKALRLSAVNRPSEETSAQTLRSAQTSRCG
ncbi:MAG: hypothetical protein KME40_23735 [Komarekiella atlantica HA4396-MV6]|nr:hypothetical protein [Komarekiella atlantica HA4396-MV6]